jgi:hypothetical protein
VAEVGKNLVLILQSGASSSAPCLSCDHASPPNSSPHVPVLV